MFVDSYEHLMERSELEGYVRDQFTPERQLAEINNPNITTFLAIDGELHFNGKIGFFECALEGEHIIFVIFD